MPGNAAPVRSGVPQGTVLGPVISLVLISDIDENVSSFCSSFADDTRKGRPIRASVDSEHLQTDLESIYDWARRNNMGFNDDKFEVIHYSPFKHKEPNQHQYLNSSGDKIAFKDHIIDLGVLIDNDGSYKTHINSIINKAKKLSGWILRTFVTRDMRPMLHL